MTPEEAKELRQENEDLRRRIAELESKLERPSIAERPPRLSRTPIDASPGAPYNWSPAAPPAAPLPADDEARYQAFKARLIDELPGDARVLAIVTARPELLVEVERKVITVDGDTLRGRIARLIAESFFDEAQTTSTVHTELAKRGGKDAMPGVSNELVELARLGFFTRDNKWYRLVPGMKVNVTER